MKNTKLKTRFLYAGFGLMFVAGLAGSISGSLAWWAYSTRASLSYQGTSVASSEQLQIGIKTTIDLSVSGIGMTRTVINNETYYFCDAGSGLPAEYVKYYLDRTQYASVELEPITTGSYTSGDISLKNPLVSGSPYNSNPAEKDKYVHIPLAFRILRYQGGTELVPEKGENIWLADTLVEASATPENETNEVFKAIRMFTKGKYKNADGEMVDAKYVINPSDDRPIAGSTAVAGLLDISGNGYYDTYDKNGKTYNIVYGETTVSEADILAAETDDEDHHQSTTASSGIIDFNNTGNSTELSTFTSRYYKGTYHPASFADIGAKYQHYETLGTVKPTDVSGILSEGKPLCATDLTYGVADLDLTVWLEGWDHHVIDKENQHSFNLGLQFQITRL